MIIENSFIKPGKYGGGAIDVYNGKIKIVRVQEGKDDKIYAEYAYPQKWFDGGWLPKEKAVPVGVDLGEDAIKAAEMLRTWADIIETGESKEANGAPDNKQDDGDDIPF